MPPNVKFSLLKRAIGQDSAIITRIVHLICLTGMACLVALPIRAAPLPKEKITFEQHVRPILKAHCFECHGEGEKLKGGLDLRLRRLMLQGGESGPAIQPGSTTKSLLVKQLRDGIMPPRDKKLTRDEIAIIEKWISSGATLARAEPEDPGKGSGITTEERQFWAFQPVAKAAVPKTKAKDRVRTPVDAFLVAAMSKKGLAFSPDADKTTLLRRAHLDLTGLPPTPEEAAQFLADTSHDAYEKLIDRLLASPHYGERWGRHWLDVAGYADSDGYTDADTVRAYAYKYRDYVIRSFNADKPFNQFVQEQLAGDELAAGTYPNRSPEQLDKLIATGFLRMPADGTAANGIDQNVARNQVMADTIKVVSTSLTGLSVGCAQCHDHRYDPILQKDYYHLRAIFEPAYDWQKWRTPPQRLISLYTDAERAKAAEIDAEIKKVTAERDEKQKQYIATELDKELGKFEAGLAEKLRAAFNTVEAKRTPDQAKLLKENPSVNITPGVLYQYNQKSADDIKTYDDRIAKARAQKPVEEFVQALTEVPGQVPKTFLFHRGDHAQPKDAVGPGELTVLGPPAQRVDFPEKAAGLPTSGRRLAYARWLTSGEHPLLARVFVNRVWMHHFGRGIVATPSDFGMMGERPSHPELLDWLASEFQRQGWSVKQLHRLIMTSTAYRQASLRDAKKQKIDPDNRLYWRKPVQRLDAEVIRDSILAVSGALNPKQFGPAVPVREDAVGQIVVGVDTKQASNQPGKEVPIGEEEYRRSVYVQVRRSRPLAMLNSFDAPVMETNCDRRPTSTVATQALMLMNSDFMLQQSARFAARLQKAAGADTRSQVALAWQLAFGRAANERELTKSAAFIEWQAEHLNSIPKAVPVNDTKGKSAPKGAAAVEPKTQALTDFCQALLSSNEFLYVD